MKTMLKILPDPPQVIIKTSAVPLKFLVRPIKGIVAKAPAATTAAARKLPIGKLLKGILTGLGIYSVISGAGSMVEQEIEEL